MITDKMRWRGKLVSIQPRIRLTRSFDQSSHSYLGYVLRVAGTIGNQEKEFLVGIGKGAQVKHMFMAGALIEGECLPVADSRRSLYEFFPHEVSDVNPAFHFCRDLFP